jgi:PQQ-dependent catabolism-associated CXXCW motif protein
MHQQSARRIECQWNQSIGISYHECKLNLLKTGGNEMKSRILATCGATLMIAVSASASATDFPISEDAKAAFLEKYAAGAPQKAFALAKDGKRFYYTLGKTSVSEAARNATVMCAMTHGVACQLWKANEIDILAEFQKAKADSAKIIAALPADIARKPYANEDADMGVEIPLLLRDGSVVHGATPAEPPKGAKIISTADLVSLYKRESGLVVVDSLMPDGIRKPTLPNAMWIVGIGWREDKIADRLMANIGRVMLDSVPSKDTPIVSYCGNWECWFSWNAAVRLVELGYSNVFWYRGGIESWTAAKLPLVTTPFQPVL